jgi:hypothetical protein
MCENTLFAVAQKSSNLLLEIITLVSSANSMGFHDLLIVGGRSFIYIMKSKGPRIDPWGIPCFIIPQLEKNF